MKCNVPKVGIALAFLSFELVLVVLRLGSGRAGAQLVFIPCLELVVVPGISAGGSVSPSGHLSGSTQNLKIEERWLKYVACSGRGSAMK